MRKMPPENVTSKDTTVSLRPITKGYFKSRAGVAAFVTAQLHGSKLDLPLTITINQERSGACSVLIVTGMSSVDIHRLNSSLQRTSI